MKKYSKKGLKALFKKIKLLILDVDGVLTRGEIIYDSQGRELKVFNVKDGLGIFLLQKTGVRVALLTAKDSKVVARRARDMKVADVYAGLLPKESLLPRIQKKYKITLDEICFVGDDLIDIGIMRRVGLPVAVSDAVEQVKKEALYITRRKGGEGAVREVVDLIIAAAKSGSRVEKWLQSPF